MTKALQEVIDRLRDLPEDRQNDLARLMLHEIEEDQRWAQSTEQNAGKLQGLIDGVLEADRRGECEPLDSDSL